LAEQRLQVIARQQVDDKPLDGHSWRNLRRLAFDALPILPGRPPAYAVPVLAIGQAKAQVRMVTSDDIDTQERRAPGRVEREGQTPAGAALELSTTVAPFYKPSP